MSKFGTHEPVSHDRQPAPAAVTQSCCVTCGFLQTALRARPEFIASRVVHTALRRVRGPRPASKQEKKKERAASALTSSIFHTPPPPLPDVKSPSTFCLLEGAGCQRTGKKSLFLHLWRKEKKKKQATYIDCRGQYKPAGVLIFTLYEVIILFWRLLSFSCFFPFEMEGTIPCQTHSLKVFPKKKNLIHIF